MAENLEVHKKGSGSEAANYHPISLLSEVGKMLEGILARRLTSHLDSQHLSARQFGFRKPRSATDLTYLLSNEWSGALDQGRPTGALALDMAGAFDRVCHTSLVERLHAVGVGGAVLELLRDYLHEREMRAVHNGQQSFPVKIGARKEQEVTAHLNTTLRRLENWGAQMASHLRSLKAQLLVVSRLAQDIRPTLNGAQLTPQQELQILGVMFDSKLTYQAHIRKLACLRRMSGLLDSKGREMMYKAEIRSSRVLLLCLRLSGVLPLRCPGQDSAKGRTADREWPSRAADRPLQPA
ncbi:uncharacterized protein LOC135113846 [Scylla paramamosain]|uniref:uncharacterized protein LOC135113846 n=1 Tax=Scylla paramamosain TaxID=85552 RepID=UPI0030834C42